MKSLLLFGEPLVLLRDVCLWLAEARIATLKEALVPTNHHVHLRVQKGGIVFGANQFTIMRPDLLEHRRATLLREFTVQDYADPIISNCDFSFAEEERLGLLLLMRGEVFH